MAQWGGVGDRPAERSSSGSKSQAGTTAPRRRSLRPTVATRPAGRAREAALPEAPWPPPGTPASRIELQLQSCHCRHGDSGSEARTPSVARVTSRRRCHGLAAGGPARRAAAGMSLVTPVTVPRPSFKFHSRLMLGLCPPGCRSSAAIDGGTPGSPGPAKGQHSRTFLDTRSPNRTDALHKLHGSKNHKTISFVLN